MALKVKVENDLVEKKITQELEDLGLEIVFPDDLENEDSEEE